MNWKSFRNHFGILWCDTRSNVFRILTSFEPLHAQFARKKYSQRSSSKHVAASSRSQPVDDRKYESILLAASSLPQDPQCFGSGKYSSELNSGKKCFQTGRILYFPSFFFRFYCSSPNLKRKLPASVFGTDSSRSWLKMFAILRWLSKRKTKVNDFSN